ncbi:MAG: FtsX-like permease family protein [Dehalococcoidia bacterium]|nr:FtsX-like permease family protein [Dehalococcoidia bacterium]
MLARLIAKSLIVRRRQLAVAVMAVLLAATLVAALFTLSLEMKSKAGRELEAYGPNMLLLPNALSLPVGSGKLGLGQVAAGTRIASRSLAFLESGQLKGIRSYAPYLYTVAIWQGQEVVVTGTSFAGVRELASQWKVEGDWVRDPPDEKSSIIGRNVAERFGLRPGDEFLLKFEQDSGTFRVVGIVETGSSEDNQVFIDLGTAQTLSGRTGQVDMVQIRASGEETPLPMIAAEIEQNIPGVEARVIGQIAQAEEKVLSKVQLIMGLLTIAALLATGLVVFSTMTASVLERTKEIGLMKALGARSGWIMLVFLAEAWVIGIAGGVLGNAIGGLLAQIIGRSVFNTHLSFRGAVIPVTFVAALLVTTLASLWPVRNALTVEPIVALRGE